ncbi:MAG: chloramphenicol acetyltransferase [Clostridia bacterium]|nr:chloramphenicol acetyltransferase [Clostridia bacterium]
MEYRVIDLAREPRRAQFGHFLQMENPQVGVTVPVDVSRARRFARERGASFYLVFLHLAALAANAVPELRRRIRDGGIVEYPRCDTSHTELPDSGIYCYCTLRHDMGWDAYLPYAEAARAACLAAPSLEEDADVESYLFISALPWLNYTQLIQPTDGRLDSHPRISWGRCEQDALGRLMMPVTLQAHHGLVDGIHIAQFFDRLKAELNALPLSQTEVKHA